MIFDKRIELKPYEYPQLLEYKDAIRKSYWIVEEYNFTSDIQDFNVNLSESEKEIIKKTMLAIAQIEVKVKDFWWDISKTFPKPEIASVWYTFAESEVRHMDAYSHLLELLWLNWNFKQLTKVPCIKKRIEYLTNSLSFNKLEDKEISVLWLILFSLLIEHVSLFSQFLIMLSFKRFKNCLNWVSNTVSATALEEQIHWDFWIELVNIIKEEYPDLISRDVQILILEKCQECHEAEMEILDWIFESWELEFLPKEHVSEFIKDRINKSLKALWIWDLYETDKSILKQINWFNEETTITKHVDFFVSRSVNYSKRNKSITWDDLF